jgi:hypothetical protein
MYLTLQDNWNISLEIRRIRSEFENRGCSLVAGSNAEYGTNNSTLAFLK